MGLCFSLDQEELKARARSEAIDRTLQLWAKEEENVIKILLLGTAEGGKSTLVKQMKIIHNEGFSHEELLSFKTAVLDNLVSSMKFVLTGMGMLRINLQNPDNRVHAQVIMACMRCYDKKAIMLPHVYKALKLLWHDRGVRHSVFKGYEYELNDSAIYTKNARIEKYQCHYFENMDRISSPSYVPTAKDVLRARVRTTGVIETCFKIESVIIRMFDVGGQRSERRKWIQCFDDVRCILFVVALSSYDLYLYEDTRMNRLVESLTLFRQICNNRFFINTTMILFLNKLDLFQDKILHSGRHLKKFFADYPGPERDVDSALRYIQHLFMMQNNLQTKVIYPHFTTATDTSNIQVVFQVVMDSILRDNLKSFSIL